jgi:O-antigen/teichoic acid export membrane protein
MIWSVVQQVGGQVATMVVFFILAALLPPRDFGLVGMAGAWLAVLNAFCETGFGAAVIQREHLRPDHLSSTFGINLAVGMGLTLLGVGLSWPAAVYFRTPELQPVMAALSLGFGVRAFGLTQAALAQRELRFRALAIRDLVSSVIGGCFGIGLAVAGYGVWSLVGMTLLSSVLATAMLWRLARWRPRRLEMSRKAAAELWPYSSRMLGFNLLKALGQNTDRLILGPLLGVHALGLYTLATRAVIFPVTTFVGAVGNYMFPKVARVQAHRLQVRAVYRAVLIAILNVILPGLAALAILAPAVVPLLGSRWSGAVPIVQVLTIAALAQAVIAPVGQLMKGLGRPGWLIVWSIGFTLLTAVALWIGAAWGLIGASIAFAIVHAAALPLVLVIGWRLSGLGLVDLFKLSWRPAAGAVALAAGLAIVSHFVAGHSPPALAVGALAAGAVYLMALARLSPEFTGLAVRELRKLRPSREEPAAVVAAARRS